MKEELSSACNFLAELLQRRSVNETLTTNFSSCLQTLLGNHYNNHWFPEKPAKGSGYRCLRINHKMDPFIRLAGEMIGIPETSLRNLLPAELTLWIDPHEVSYRIGENGSECLLFTQSTTRHCLQNQFDFSVPEGEEDQSFLYSSSPSLISSSPSLSSSFSSPSSSPSSSPPTYFPSSYTGHQPFNQSTNFLPSSSSGYCHNNTTYYPTPSMSGAISYMCKDNVHTGWLNKDSAKHLAAFVSS